MDKDQPFFLKFALGFFMTPYLVFALTWGAFSLYRAFQIIWVILLLVAFFVCRRNVSNAISFHAIAVSTILLLSSISAIAFDLSSTLNLDFLLLMKTAMLVSIIVLVDHFRDIGFERFMRDALPVAVLLVFLTAIHFALNPVVVYGRYLFFGLHPNLGGELLLACTIIVVYAPSVMLRWIVGFLILVLLTFLQSRAALAGSFLVLMLSESFRIFFFPGQSKRRQLFGFIFVFVGLASFLSVIFNPELIAKLASFVYNDLFLMDNLYRGAGTGLVGRGDTWLEALSSFSDNPFFGTGLDRATDDDELAIHSGYLALLAEFGLLSLGFLSF